MPKSAHSDLRFHPATREEADRYRHSNPHCVTGHEQVRFSTNGTFIVSCQHCKAPDFTEALATA